MIVFLESEMDSFFLAYFKKQVFYNLLKKYKKQSILFHELFKYFRFKYDTLRKENSGKMKIEWDETMYTSKIKIDICSLEIISDPSHPWMVMIHGFGGTRHMWKRQVEQFKDCYNLMIVELPGHGDSEDGVSGHEDMNFTEIAKLLITHIHKKNIFKAHFLCVSLGSLIMSAIAELCPELVDSVLLCGAIFGMDSFGKFLLHSGNAIKHFFPYMLVIRMLATILMPKSSHKVSRKFLVMECEKLGRKEFLKWYSLLCMELNRLGEHIGHFTHINTLVVMGDEDHMFLHPAQQMAAENPHIKTLLMQQCGHVCSLQKWREFNVIAAQFFQDGTLPKTKELEQIHTTAING